MYLKSVTLKGFKSFASSTNLIFERGITCVVGPNGSGKSNVVDALSWVMGEQGAKSLRGGKMEDVIFAGTSGRAPLGRAEVSVTIDNTDNALPIEFTEVTITRILFRNGTSEYQLNGETTRLLDIQELLSDSGIGREMHVIVGQGQLDAILLANPEERRAFIEEAAGVLKHRKRKEKALRKLDSMQANLARIQDLTVELRRQLKPLGKQAEVARKASTIQSDVRDSRLRLLADDLIALKSTLDAEVADETSLRMRRDSVEAELNQLRNREEELDAISLVENPQLVRAQENFYHLTAQREKFRGIQSLASERAKFLSEERDEARASGRDPGAMDAEAHELRAEETKFSTELTTKRTQLAQINSELQSAEARLAQEENQVSNVLRTISSLLEKTGGQIEGSSSKVAQFKSDIARGVSEIEAWLNNFGAEIVEIATNVKNAQQELDRVIATITGASGESSLARPDLTKLEDLRAKVTTTRARDIEARLELRTLEERITALAARAKALEDSARAEREGAVQFAARTEQRAVAATRAQEIADLAYEALIQLEVTLSKALAERERLEKARTEREGETLSIRGKIRELTTELEKLTSSVHQDEIARAEQRLRIEQLEGRAVEELGVDVTTLISEYGPENDVPTFIEDAEGNFIPGDLIPYRRDQQEKRLAQAERNLALLGKINPLALEEYSALEERLKYLAEQLEDLKKTKKDLLDIIKEVDDKVVEIFKEAYLDTAREFETIFARLFPGGDGRLILTDPDNFMTTGVDVEARPPGKRVKRLSLLSGGERSLVAVAMLVAIFKARPSPFYVMDEVEAALDDTNLGRLLGVFEELREKSQLIIITHQKRTMEIADALYGVTMRGDGVSEVISQRLRESESV